MSTMNPVASQLDSCWITDADDHLRDDFDQRPFEFEHNLTDHPLLQLPELMKLADRSITDRPGSIYYDMGDIPVTQRWDEVPERRFSALESMERIETCGAWFLFKKIQQDPVYKEVLGRGWQEIKARIAPNLDSKILREDALVFITSPNRIAPYHIDRECSFLLQIRGTKKIYIFDRSDRDVLSEAELERYWTVDHNAPKYKPHLQDRAIVYTLRPGMGVHIPVNWPHWLQNDDNVSVSLNVNVQFKDTQRANVYRANYLLRRMGMRPSPPGVHPGVDRVKAISMIPVMATKPMIKSLRDATRKKAH
ncbi:cupin-like domain-containing protein [Acidicapsa dinghuensis]|uniref:Cupin-like domain-containing protein n=1 Tax=Acidicapsa dinghuensis TaxID=2218256 RepID=A0ABW1EF47_9BACT|nr:cupin-like domain-containing protein [Acidicapsa dinghuensis]